MEKEQKRAGVHSRLRQGCSAGHYREGPRPTFVASLAPRSCCSPSRYTPSFSSPLRFLPLSALIVFRSDKDLITHEVVLEPEPPLGEKASPHQ